MYVLNMRFYRKMKCIAFTRLVDPCHIWKYFQSASSSWTSPPWWRWAWSQWPAPCSRFCWWTINVGFVTQRIPEFERYKGLFIYRLKLVVSSSPLRHPCAGSSTRAQGHRTLIVPGACMAKPGFRKTFFQNRTDLQHCPGNRRSITG